MCPDKSSRMLSAIFRYLEEILIPSGEKTAKEAYGADGWTAHVVSNPWGFTSLGWAYNWGVFSLGGAWCAVMAWDYYEYTGDLDFCSSMDFLFWKGSKICAELCVLG